MGQICKRCHQHDQGCTAETGGKWKTVVIQQGTNLDMFDDESIDKTPQRDSLLTAKDIHICENPVSRYERKDELYFERW